MKKMSKSSTQVWKSIGSSVEAQLATRDGVVFFKRYRDRDPRYGWKWTAWKVTEVRPSLTHNGQDDACWAETVSGWIPEYREMTVRLPKGN
jgi:hypothetical protein